MIITLKAFATLQKYMPEHADAYEVPEGTTVQELLDRLGLSDDQVRLVFINGAHVSLQAVIAEGDRLGLFPAVGGG
ncbi:MAG: MoaD/ThiS family protein [Proteobacteria bacterium]|nr:MoaD/ThiS family protein [Pseudomonadota bacterium]